jgi:hypothetical protein
MPPWNRTPRYISAFVTLATSLMVGACHYATELASRLAPGLHA